MGHVEEKSRAFEVGLGDKNDLSLNDFARLRVTAKPSFESKSSLEKHCSVQCMIDKMSKRRREVRVTLLNLCVDINAHGCGQGSRLNKRLHLSAYSNWLSRQNARLEKCKKSIQVLSTLSYVSYGILPYGNEQTLGCITFSVSH